MADIFAKINWVDALVVILLIRGTYVGSSTGFIWGFFKVFGISVVSILAIQNYTVLSEYISYYTPLSIKIAEFISFVAITVIGIFVFYVIRVLLHKLLKIEFVKVIEKPGGVVMGFVFSCIFISMILINMVLMPISYIGKSITERSLVGDPFLRIAPQLYNTVMSFYPDINRIDTARLTDPVYPEDIQKKPQGDKDAF